MFGEGRVCALKDEISIIILVGFKIVDLDRLDAGVQRRGAGFDPLIVRVAAEIDRFTVGRFAQEELTIGAGFRHRQEICDDIAVQVTRLNLGGRHAVLAWDRINRGEQVIHRAGAVGHQIHKDSGIAGLKLRVAVREIRRRMVGKRHVGAEVFRRSDVIDPPCLDHAFIIAAVRVAQAVQLCRTPCRDVDLGGDVGAPRVAVGQGAKLHKMNGVIVFLVVQKGGVQLREVVFRCGAGVNWPADKAAVVCNVVRVQTVGGVFVFHLRPRAVGGGAAVQLKVGAGVQPDQHIPVDIVLNG